MISTTPQITIIGGGLAGIVLLLTLHRRGVPATAYEEESGYDACDHLDGTLGLDWDGGQRALRDNGLQELFDQCSRPAATSGAFRICDAAGNTLFLMSQSDGGFKNAVEVPPEIDCSVLCKLLLDACPADSIKWGHALASVRSLDNGQHELAFTNGTSTICDFLVGADGANSRVRPLLSPATTLADTTMTGAGFSIPPNVVALSELSGIRELVGRGDILVAVQNSRLLGMQMNGTGHLNTWACIRGPEDFLPRAREPGEARKVLLEAYTGWSPTFLKLIEHCDAETICLDALHQVPVDHSWTHVQGATLIGGAAHPTFPGDDANLAMLDGLELGLVLADAVSNGKTVAEREMAIEAWEGKMCAMAGVKCAVSNEVLQTIFNPQTYEIFIARAKSYASNLRGGGAADA